MFLFEIITNSLGESYVRSYAWAASEDHAKRMFAEKHPTLVVMRVVKCFGNDSDPFVSTPSDCGFELEAK